MKTATSIRWLLVWAMVPVVAAAADGTKSPARSMRGIRGTVEFLAEGPPVRAKSNQSRESALLVLAHGQQRNQQRQQ